MIHYSYNRQIQPPAPFVNVSVRCAETQKQSSHLPAQLDTAADRSAIPGSVAGELGLRRSSGPFWMRNSTVWQTGTGRRSGGDGISVGSGLFSLGIAGGR